MTIPVTAYFRMLHVPQLYVIALGTGVCSAFFGITYQSYLPAIVAKEHLPNANVKLESSNSAANMAGISLAGLLVQGIGAATSIAFDAASYLVSVIFLTRIRVAEPKHERPTRSARQAFRKIVEGVRTVLDTRNLRWIAAATATSNFGGSIIGVVTLIYAYRGLQQQPGPIGDSYWESPRSAVGALVSTRIRDRFGLRATLFGALILTALGNACMLFAQVAFPYLALFVAAAIAAMAIPVYNVN